MTDEWVWLWFRCLKLNNVYHDYCDAQSAGDADAIAEHVQNHPRIADVYADFGDIYAFNERVGDRKHWKAWLRQRRHLFEETVQKTATQTIITHAKYILASKQKTTAKQLQTVKRRLAVWHILQPLNDKPPTGLELVELLSKHKKGNPADWDWSWDVINGRGLNDNFRTQALHYRKQAASMIANTINGQFPVV